MDLAHRIARYAAIEQYRKRPLIVYATSTRPGIRAIMAADTVREFIDQLDTIPNENEAVDVLIHSSGGDALAAWKLMSILRERFSRVGVLVPFAAFSAATIFALGADEIIMHPHASLGPIDPQIGVRLPDGSTRQFAYEDLVAFLGFLANDMKLTDQQHVSTVVEKLFSTVDPLVVGAAKRASELAVDVGERLLSTHLSDAQRAKQIAVNLNKSFFAHGDAVSRQRAIKLGLQVSKKSEPALETLIWQAYQGIEDYMELRKPLNHLHMFLADPAGAASLAAPAPLNLPPNTPPQVMQQILQAVANQAIQMLQGHGVEVAFSVPVALVESSRAASEFRTDGRISASRQQGGEVRLSVIETGARWSSVPMPAITAAPDAGVA
jgi:hypothetical protein